MRRPLWNRAVAAVMAVWLAIVMAEPAALHSCPMHGGLAVGASAAGQEHAVSAVPHPGSTDAAMHRGAPAPGHGGGHQCTCLGRCAAAVGVAAPAPRVVLTSVVETAATRDSGLPDFEYVPVAAAHVLPFANGPPTVA
jgi:hypothetical protein